VKNLITIIAVICIFAGCVIGHYSTIPAVDYGAVALESFGFATLIIKTLKKAKEKTWKEYTGVGLFVVAGICCAVACIAEATMSQLISIGFAVVAMIAGLITIKKKNA
jgi:hypothetical protein